MGYLMFRKDKDSTPRWVTELLVELLRDERARFDELNGRVNTTVFPQATKFPDVPAQSWTDIPFEDEATEDVRGLLSEGRMTEAEAYKNLEGLGFSDAEIVKALS